MIKDILKQKKNLISFEVFPPKTEEGMEQLFDTLTDLKPYAPDFISVTYGAGGSTSKKTAGIAAFIKNECKLEALAHVTCVAHDEASLQVYLNEILSLGIENVLALRGDKPKDMTEEQFASRHFTYASDIIPLIHKWAKKDITVAGACYPEVHTEAVSKEADLEALKKKVECGVDLLITQLFYDNEIFYRFYEDVRKMGVETPICAGIMPVTTVSGFKNTITMSGSSVPKELLQQVEKYSENPEDLKKAGLEFALKQIQQLRNFGVEGIHLYPLNKKDVSKYLLENI